MIKAALVGNPNVGKTTLFNLLTGSNQYVGNWAGVTVEKKEGFYDKDLKIVDLPGIYAFDTFSNEEKITKKFLQADETDIIINIVDAGNLMRNLYLTMQLKQFNKPIILVINMIDSLEAKGISIDFDLLEKQLGVKIATISASKKIGIDKLITLLKSGDFFKEAIENDYQQLDEAETYSEIDQILKLSLKQKKTSKKSITEKIDRIVLNKVLAYPIFLGLLYLIFQFTFKWVGTPLADFIDHLNNEYFIVFLNKLLASSSPWFRSLIVEGIVSGVGSVVIFLPLILTLFLGISFLEDSGYMARAAFIMDKIMRRMGLSGKAFIPLIIGFGCSVPGIMSARTLESEKDRKLTALLVPLMSCNARLPVYALFASLFFKGYENVVVFSLYLLGIGVAFVIGLLFKNTIFKKDEEPFIIELPDYKMPSPRNLALHTIDKGKDFLKKAGTIILAMSFIVWILANFNFHGSTDINSSFLAGIGKFIAPIFTPLGFGNWEASVSLLTGLMAKEAIISSMGVIYKGGLEAILPHHFTQITAYAFLVFTLLYTPCLSVIGVIKKEYGNKMAIFSVAYQLVLAYIAAFLVNTIGGIIW